MSHPLSRRLFAEALGTGVLVATVVGSGIMAERLADGNGAVALLGNTIPTGAILVVLITILGPVSGAHFNPAVSLVFAARRELPWREVAPYIVMQCVGGIIGTIAAHLMFDLAPLMIGTQPRTGPSQWFILSAGMIAMQGRIQREGEVVHLVAQRLTDLSAELASVGGREAAFPLPHGRGDEFHHGSPGIDPRTLPPKGPRPRDIYVPDLHIDSTKVKTRDFR